MDIVILITARDTAQAKKISRALVQEHSAACVNIVSNIQSLFWWAGKVDSSKEALMIVKSQKKCFGKIFWHRGAGYS